MCGVGVGDLRVTASAAHSCCWMPGSSECGGTPTSHKQCRVCLVSGQLVRECCVFWGVTAVIGSVLAAQFAWPATGSVLYLRRVAGWKPCWVVEWCLWASGSWGYSVGRWKGEQQPPPAQQTQFNSGKHLELKPALVQIRLTAESLQDPTWPSTRQTRGLLFHVQHSSPQTVSSQPPRTQQHHKEQQPQVRWRRTGRVCGATTTAGGDQTPTPCVCFLPAH